MGSLTVLVYCLLCIFACAMVAILIVAWRLQARLDYSFRTPVGALEVRVPPGGLAYECTKKSNLHLRVGKSKLIWGRSMRIKNGRKKKGYRCNAYR